MEPHSRFIKLAVISVGLLTGVGTALWAYTRTPDGIIADGVRVAGMDWSKKSTAVARADLQEWRKARLRETVSLTLPPEARSSRKWTPPRAEIGVDVDVDATVQEAAAVGQQDGFFTRLSRLFSGPKKVEIEPRWIVDANKLRKYLKRQIAPGVAQEKRDARFLVLKSGFKIVPERPGTTLDLEGAVKTVSERAQSVSAEPITLPVRIAIPHVTAADLRGINGEVAHFSTHYSETGNRRRNIETACSHINGTVLKPGDVFSYNKVVGPRDPDYGFRLAPVIIQGRLRPGMGGGVCQVSSTLYNAVLLADLKIVRRTHHAFPVHYLPAGRDATVAYDSLDLRFQNDTGSAIAIAADGTGGRVLMRVFGKRVPGREVKIERTSVSSWGPGVEIIHDSSLSKGHRSTIDRGHAGHRVTVWRKVALNGKLVKRELISHDYYHAFPRLVAVGTREVVRRPVRAVPARTSGPPPETRPAPDTPQPVAPPPR